jgi:hypothetical protein
MHISEFAKPVTSKSLNESLARRFGNKIKLETYTLEQLQDARNKLRTKLSQVEMTENFNTVVESDSYQKSKLMLDILNAAITERGDIEEAVDQDSDGDNDFDDVKIARMMASGMSKPEAIAKVKGSSSSNDDTNEGAYGKKKKKRKMSEGAEDQAEIVMAAKEMVDRLTGWMEDTAEMQTESMLELADAIRDEMGSQQSQAYVDSIKPALQDLYSAMEVTRGALSSGVGMLTGEEQPAAPMGAEEPMPAGDEMAMEPTVDMEAPVDDGEGFAVAGAAAGGDEAAGRARRESIQFNEGSEEAEQLIAAYRHMMKIGNKAGAQLILGVLKQKYPDAVKQLNAGPQSNPAPNQSAPMSTPNQRESVDPRKLANKLASSKKK